MNKLKMTSSTDVQNNKISMDVVYELCADLLEKISETIDNNDKEKLIHSYIDQVLSKVGPVTDFRPGLEWFNVSSPLFLKQELAGKLVLLDFFTYCCINCLHVLPELKNLEKKYPVTDGLIVVGVHSAKFEAEKLGENVSAAVSRHEISHPVVNDVGAIMWSELDIACWPTLLLLGPGGYPLFILMGEGHSVILDLLVRSSLAYFSSHNKLSLAEINQISPSMHLGPASPLSFPGRVAMLGDKLAISDSGHHRVLVVNLTTGVVEKTIGGGESGLVDGDFDEAKFHSPQGLAWLDENVLFVADTENHAIREVDLGCGRVKTVAGTGQMGSDKEGGQVVATSQPLSSPWGLALDPSKRVLLIAMAGTHQIWGLALLQTNWWKARVLEAGTCVALAGSGREENRNSNYPMAAGFAQPSGLAVAGQNLLVADSESSSVRIVSLLYGKVSPLAGAEKDPMNLFSYGDTDGRGTEAKLQHPLDVAWSIAESSVFVADTFNHKIKRVTLETGACETVKLPGDAKLREPGGICVDEERGRLIIADTNHHCIKLVELRNNCSVSQLELTFPTEMDSRGSSKSHQWMVKVGEEGGELLIDLYVTFSKGQKPAAAAPQSWKLTLPELWTADAIKGKLEVTTGGLRSQVKIHASAGHDPCDLSLTLGVVSCDDDAGQCRMESLRAEVKVQRSSEHQDQLEVRFDL